VTVVSVSAVSIAVSAGDGGGAAAAAAGVSTPVYYGLFAFFGVFLGLVLCGLYQCLKPKRPLPAIIIPEGSYAYRERLKKLQLNQAN
jgi:hypothetical protein